LLQVVEYQGHWVALLDWGPACWKRPVKLSTLRELFTSVRWKIQEKVASEVMPTLSTVVPSFSSSMLKCRLRGNLMLLGKSA
jgi:hypothetical protein